jgi:MFS family permease
MIGPTIVLDANRMGASLTNVGLIPTIYGLGFLIGCLWSRRLIMEIGHIRSFTFAAALLAALTLLLNFIPSPFVWMLFRGIMGCVIAIIMTCIDSWVSHVAPYEMRGRVMGFYSTATKVAYTGSPALLAYSAFINEQAIILSVLLIILSLIPICLTKLPQPVVEPTATASFYSLVREAPSAIVAVFILGFTNTAVLNLIPVYGVELGLDDSDALKILMFANLGGLLAQWPLGYLSDKVGRRMVMTAGFFISAIASIAMVLSSSTYPFLSLIFSFLWGAAALSIYSVALSHAIDHVKNERTIAVCSTVLTIWSIGSIFGPLIAGVLMDNFNVYALYILCGTFHGLTALFIFIRMMTTARRIHQ